MPEAETLICPQVPFLPLGHFFFLCIPPWNKHVWPLRLLVPALLHMAQYSGWLFTVVNLATPGMNYNPEMEATPVRFFSLV